MLKTIHVLATDIRKGLRGNAAHCPIARACRREGLDSAMVRHSSVEWHYVDFVPAVAFLPIKAQIFIRRFDDHKIPKESFRPFAFRIEMKGN
jgi:hypothetical protein